MRKQIKNDFPIFKKAKLSQPQWFYLDSAATSQKPQAVIRAMANWYEKYNANIHRGVYQLSEQATAVYENSRQTIANFIKASPEEIIFTRGTTEGINLVAWSWARANLKKGDKVLLTEMEHHANIVPWQQLAQEKKIKLEFWPINKKGELILPVNKKSYDRLFKGVKLLSLVHVSNVLGTINPLTKICFQAKARGIKILVDAAQSVPHFPVDIKKIGCDWLAFSGHKMLGPTGIGILYIKKERYTEMVPYQTGGDMIKHVDFVSSTFASPPQKFEAGTQHMEGVVGLAAAVLYLQKLGMEKIRQHDQMLVSYALQEIKKIPQVEIYGPGSRNRCGAIAFNVSGIHAHDLATFFDQLGVCIRAGHHCAQPLHQKMNITASARISFHIYNNKGDIDFFIKSLKNIINQWQTSIDKK